MSNTDENGVWDDDAAALIAAYACPDCVSSPLAIAPAAELMTMVIQHAESCPWLTRAAGPCAAAIVVIHRPCNPTIDDL